MVFISFLNLEIFSSLESYCKAQSHHRIALEILTSKMEKLQLELRVKEDNVLELSLFKENLEKENKDLLSSRDDFSNRLRLEY